jgi:Txe/YoeB family toxin of Txe-Axe toxin-antitoxin module
MRTIAFTQTAFEEYNSWFAINEQVVSRIRLLIRDINNDPF